MKRKLLYFTICCVVFLVSCSAQEDLGNFTSSPVNSGKPDADTIVNPDIEDSTNIPPIVPEEPMIISKNVVIAHRGAWKKNNFPQNSIASLNEAIRLKCKGSEFDILLTSDDSLVINHDDKYNNLFVERSKYQDLVVLKLSNGETLPTLREYIEAAKQNNTTTLLFCELKNYNLSAVRKNIFIKKTLELVNKLKAQDMIVYISFDYDLLKQIRVLNANANLQYLKGDLKPEQLKLDNITGADYPIDVYTSHLDWIDKAKKNGVKLSVWTVNDSYNVKLFLNYNFESITTDEPEFLLSFKS